MDIENLVKLSVLSALVVKNKQIDKIASSYLLTMTLTHLTFRIHNLKLII